jgi:hypothetical protein
VIRWNTETDELEHGSWFYGRIYEQRCDLSFDGRWMVYFASAQHLEGWPTWTGICRPPWLKAFDHQMNIGTYFGGGYFSSKDQLTIHTDLLEPPLVVRQLEAFPFSITSYKSNFNAADLGVVFSRFNAEGWARIGSNYGTDRKIEASQYTVIRDGDEGWVRRPSKDHPPLHARYVGYFGGKSGYTFAFHIQGYEEMLLDVDWANYDSLGNLIFSRKGSLHKTTLEDLINNRITTQIDLEHLKPPERLHNNETLVS